MAPATGAAAAGTPRTAEGRTGRMSSELQLGHAAIAQRPPQGPRQDQPSPRAAHFFTVHPIPAVSPPLRTRHSHWVASGQHMALGYSCPGSPKTPGLSQTAGTGQGIIKTPWTRGTGQSTCRPHGWGVGQGTLRFQGHQRSLQGGSATQGGNTWGGSDSEADRLVGAQLGILPQVDAGVVGQELLSPGLVLQVMHQLADSVDSLDTWRASLSHVASM